MTRYLLIGGKRYEIDYDASTGDYTIGPEVTLPEDSVVSDLPELVDVQPQMYSSSDTNLSINETYNKLSINCELNELSDLISSPLSEDDLYTPYSNSVHWARELVSWGEGERALKGFRDYLLSDNTTTPQSSYDNAEYYDHYVQLWKSKNWQFNSDPWIDETNGKNQWRVLQRARANTCIAFIASFGHTQMQNVEKDNSIPGKPSMTKYLCIALNGNRKDSEPWAYPSVTDLENSAPLATFTGSLAGGYLSPVDNLTTNYIVFKGKFILCSSQ